MSCDTGRAIPTYRVYRLYVKVRTYGARAGDQFWQVRTVKIGLAGPMFTWDHFWRDCVTHLRIWYLCKLLHLARVATWASAVSIKFTQVQGCCNHIGRTSN